MAEAVRSIEVEVCPEKFFQVITDFERYPEWAKDVKDVVVRTRDDEGRAMEVEYRASALGRSTHYTLGYDYAEAPGVLDWRMIRGDIMRTIDGSYHFSATPEGGTEVRYDLVIDLVVPLPGFVKRRAEVRILNTVRELKARAEACRFDRAASTSGVPNASAWRSALTENVSESCASPPPTIPTNW